MKKIIFRILIILIFTIFIININTIQSNAQVYTLNDGDVKNIKPEHQGGNVYAIFFGTDTTGTYKIQLKGILNDEKNPKDNGKELYRSIGDLEYNTWALNMEEKDGIVNLTDNIYQKNSVTLEKGKTYVLYINLLGKMSISQMYFEKVDQESSLLGTQANPFSIDISTDRGTSVITIDNNDEYKNLLYQDECMYFKVETTGSYNIYISAMEGTGKNLQGVKITDESGKSVSWAADGSLIIDYDYKNLGTTLASALKAADAYADTDANGGRILYKETLYKIDFGNLSGLASTELPIKSLGFIKVSNSTQTYQDAVDKAKDKAKDEAKDKEEETDFRLASASIGKNGGGTLENPLTDTDAYSDINQSPSFNKDTTSKVGKILASINLIGVVIAVIVLVIIGIKYVLGSVEQKAEYKQTMLGYVFGAILLASGTTIVNVLYQFAQSL